MITLPPYNVERILRKDECPECNGKGIVANPVNSSTWNNWGRTAICCPTCEGYGFVKPKKEKEGE